MLCHLSCKDFESACKNVNVLHLLTSVCTCCVSASQCSFFKICPRDGVLLSFLFWIISDWGWSCGFKACSKEKPRLALHYVFWDLVPAYLWSMRTQIIKYEIRTSLSPLLCSCVVVGVVRYIHYKINVWPIIFRIKWLNWLQMFGGIKQSL